MASTSNPLTGRGARKRIQYDLYYIDNWSLWFDLRILAVTAHHILFSRNAH